MNMWDRVEFFTRKEFLCPCCGEEKMNESFMLTLDRIRRGYGHPILPSSGWRCSEYNAKISTTGRDGPHTTGRAVDIPVYGTPALLLISQALRNGITGVGLQQTGPYGKRFVHLDTLDGLSDRPRPWVWTY